MPQPHHSDRRPAALRGNGTREYRNLTCKMNLGPLFRDWRRAVDAAADVLARKLGRGAPPNAALVEGDVLDRKTLDAAVAGQDVV